MPRLLLASSVPSVPTPEPLATSGLNSTASITASSMTLTHWSRPSASSPLHDTAEREQNSHSSHYNGLRHRQLRRLWLDLRPQTTHRLRKSSRLYCFCCGAASGHVIRFTQE